MVIFGKQERNVIRQSCIHVLASQQMAEEEGFSIHGVYDGTSKCSCREGLLMDWHKLTLAHLDMPGK